MAAHGKNFELTVRSGKIIVFRNISIISVSESGVARVWDMEGNCIATYSPCGWLNFNQFTEPQEGYGG